MFEFKLADVGEGMHEAEILRWLVAPGDRVKLDQPIVEIQTDKAVVELPAPVAGTVEAIKFEVGQLAHVGDVLIVFEDGIVGREPGVAKVPANQVALEANISASAFLLPPSSRVKAAPAVRKRAVELEIDINQIQPGSPDGRVLLSDVEAYAARRKQGGSATVSSPTVLNGHQTETLPSPATAHTNGSASNNGSGNELSLPKDTKSVPTVVQSIIPDSRLPTTDHRIPLAGLRRRIAERMELSWRTIPHVTVFDEVEATELVGLRGKLIEAAQKRGTRLTYLPFIVKAVTRVLKQFPVFNASLDEQSREIIYKQAYHIGIATATPDGLLVPVVREADRLSLLELAAEINRLGEGGRNRTLKGAELSGSTFTISNVGSFGGVIGTAIINPPEAAILAVGRLVEKAVVRESQLVVRTVLPISMSFDHRLIDGAEAGQFMSALKELLENPHLLWLDA